MKQAGLRLTTTIPDDTIELEGDFERYGGKSDGDAVAELLKRLGYPLEEPEYLDFKGWEYRLEIKGRAYGYRSQRWPTWAFLVFFDHKLIPDLPSRQPIKSDLNGSYWNAHRRSPPLVGIGNRAHVRSKRRGDR